MAKTPWITASEAPEGDGRSRLRDAFLSWWPELSPEEQGALASAFPEAHDADSYADAVADQLSGKTDDELKSNPGFYAHYTQTALSPKKPAKDGEKPPVDDTCPDCGVDIEYCHCKDMAQASITQIILREKVARVLGAPARIAAEAVAQAADIRQDLEDRAALGEVVAASEWWCLTCGRGLSAEEAPRHKENGHDVQLTSPTR